MSTYVTGIGRQGITKVFSAVVTPGTTVSFSKPVKSFILKPVGGAINFKFNDSDADGDAFPIGDGEAINFDMALPFNYTDQLSTVGIIFSNSGTVSVYVAATF